MGQQHFEPAAARPERAASGEAPRIRHVRSAAILLLGLAVSIGAAHASDPPRATFLGSFVWTMDKDYFGGVSGVEVASDGVSFSAIGDSAQTYVGRFRRDDGRIVGVETEPVGKLGDASGVWLDGDMTDSEGLAVMNDGSWCVSFERIVRVSCYTTPGGVARDLPSPRGFARMSGNGALEALAVDADGALYTMDENPRERFHKVYRYAHGAWTDFAFLPVDRGWQAVGADFDDDGRLYILFRLYRPPVRFASRLVRYDVTDDAIGNPVVMFESALGEFDNLEGISVWRDGTSGIATMVSDDNHRWFQRTEFVEFRLPD